MADEPDRRGFLKVATCAIGGGIGIATAGPVLRLVLAPAGQQTVTTPREPIDIGAIDGLRVGAAWRRVDVIAPVVQDAWTTARDVVLGAAWIRRPADSKLEALSGVCPHLGCSIGWDQGTGNFLCPCHNSRWSVDGAIVPATGPAKRDLDPLPIEVKDGRLRLSWVRYKLDTTGREPA